MQSLLILFTLFLLPGVPKLTRIKQASTNALNDEKVPLPLPPKCGDGGEPSVDDSETPIVPLSRMQFALVIIAIALAVFLMALDESIIATAIPKITDRFHSLQDVAWYGSAYMLTMCSFQLHYGKLYTYFSSKTILLVSVGVFELGSVVCATSQSSTALIVGRAVAGSGAGGIVSGAFIIISRIVPMRERPMYTAVVGSIYGVASVAGPLLGGVITDSHLTWRWYVLGLFPTLVNLHDANKIYARCFYLNLPFGAFSVLIIVFLYHSPKDQSAKEYTGMEILKRMDPLGFILLVGTIVCLVLALQFSGSSGWKNPRVIILLVLVGVLLLAFAAVQVWLQEHATLPPRIIKNRQVLASSFFAMTIDGSFYGLSYYVSICSL